LLDRFGAMEFDKFSRLFSSTAAKSSICPPPAYFPALPLLPVYRTPGLLLVIPCSGALKTVAKGLSNTVEA